MISDFKGKVAFITGSASGIGSGIAHACAKHGMKVCIVDKREDALQEAMKWYNERGYDATAIPLDVTDREAYAKAADKAEEVYGKIHLLVNNAGVSAGRNAWDSTWNDWDFIMSINCMGVVNGIKTIVPRMLKHGEEAHVVSTSSTGGVFAVDGCALYNTTKFFVSGLMECCAADLQGTNVGASVLYPGPTNSQLGISSAAVRPDALKNKGEIPFAPPPRKEGEEAPKMPAFPDFSNIFMTPDGLGERVIMGVQRGDIFIWTHPEFKAGAQCRNDAQVRAIPDEPITQKRKERAEALKFFGSLTYNPVYEKQTTPPGLKEDWDRSKE